MKKYKNYKERRSSEISSRILDKPPETEDKQLDSLINTLKDNKEKSRSHNSKDIEENFIRDIMNSRNNYESFRFNKPLRDIIIQQQRPIFETPFYRNVEHQLPETFKYTRFHK